MSVDLIIHRARIFTGRPGADGPEPDADTLAIRAGRIVAVGREADVRRGVGRADEVIDAAGGLVTAGFFDAHAHVVQGGHERIGCDLTDCATAQATVAEVRAHAAALPGDAWVVGGGWSMDHFPGGRPDIDLLSAAVGGRPAFLVNRDHHGAWVSRAALAAAGIDATTPDPAGGTIDRRPDGTPSGTLQESAMDLVRHVLPAVTVADVVAAIGAAQDYLHSLGVIGWQEAIVGDYAGFPDSTDGYRAALADGVLNARVNGALWLPRTLTPDTLQDVVADLIERRRRFGDQQVTGERAASLRAPSVKIMVDGVVESHTAALREPYADLDSAGPSHFEPGVLRLAAARLAAAGFQLHFHAIGDRALAESLDAIEAARAAGDDGAMRHHVAHLQIVDRADLPRMAALGVTANLQALWAANSAQMLGLNRPLLGEHRYLTCQYPFASMRRAGVRLAMGSDWPVSSPDPWQAIHVAVNRREPERPEDEPLSIEEALDLAACVRAYTAGSASLNLQHDIGVVAPGRTADLAVADRDPFAAPAEETWQVRNRLTLVAGRVVAGR